MFLIAKIVRGRRLLHELEKEECKHEREIMHQNNQFRKSLIDSVAETSCSGSHHHSHTHQRPPQPSSAPSAEGATTAAAAAATTNNSERPTASATTTSTAIGGVGGKHGQIRHQMSCFHDEFKNVGEHQQPSGSGVLHQLNTRRMSQKEELSRVLYHHHSAMNNAAEHRREILRYRKRIPLKMTRLPLLPVSMPSSREFGEHRRCPLYSKHLRRALQLSITITTSDLVGSIREHCGLRGNDCLQTRNGGKRVENVFEEVFERMVRQFPAVRDIFHVQIALAAMSKSDITSYRGHARLIVKMYEGAIKNLDIENARRTDTNGEFDPFLIGRAHSQFKPHGFSSNLWEIMGETIIDIILCQEAVRDLPGAGAAWVILTACIVDQLRAGFESNREYFKNENTQQPQKQCPLKSRKDSQARGLPPTQYSQQSSKDHPQLVLNGYNNIYF